MKKIYIIITLSCFMTNYNFSQNINKMEKSDKEWKNDLAPLGTNWEKEFIDIAPWIVIVMKKAYDSLPEGGALIVIENIIDDERNKNAFGLMMSLNMAIETDDGFDFTGCRKP